ncbi:thermostable hemolysin (plasmid) [Sphingobium sp. SJ10-10]|uniref:thermostable hemolysin n=1 Tax=Sphingobium sp. SJ10-10 TaxID=3114999 RepID=UPI000B3CEB24|nr:MULTISPECIES: thermostable hemolysin [Sphingomonadaceae]MEC6700688.1 thermostable hemolysin [Sphingobium sp. SJ10-10]
MIETNSSNLIRRRYSSVHGARAQPCFSNMLDVARAGAPRAVLGYRRASNEPLFLECYLDAPVEDCLTTALGRLIVRKSVIEIGSLAADDAFAMVSLWAMAANDLGGECEIAVATLTAPLRQMFRRMGVPLHTLAPARADRVGDPEIWGRYYDSDPLVCAGLIAEGQRAIGAYLSARRNIAA